MYVERFLGSGFGKEKESNGSDPSFGGMGSKGMSQTSVRMHTEYCKPMHRKGSITLNQFKIQGSPIVIMHEYIYVRMCVSNTWMYS